MVCVRLSTALCTPWEEVSRLVMPHTHIHTCSHSCPHTHTLAHTLARLKKAVKSPSSVKQAAQDAIESVAN